MNPLKIRLFFFLFLTAASLYLTSCNNSYVDNINRGGGYEYIPGYPEMRVQVSNQFDINSNNILEITADIVKGSLIYKSDNQLFKASGSLEFIIKTKDKYETTVFNKELPIRFSSSEQNISYDQSLHRIQQKVDIEPGEYIVELTLTDTESRKTTNSNFEIEVPVLNTENKISDISIYTKEKDSTFYPSTTYNISSLSDSIKFTFQTSVIEDTSITVRSRLLSFEYDSTIARPMNLLDYSAGSIQFKGIDYSEFEEVNTSRRVISTKGVVSVEFKFPSLETGNYRFEISSTSNGDEEIYKARDFSVKSENYPTVKTPMELARPLYYLMDNNEYDKLISIKDPEEQKKAIDKFWLSNTKNSSIAKQVVELYYQRVEEANKQFSNYKEGWKTDQGMIYILFGPPWYVDRSLQTVIWRYSYNTNDPERNFYFDRPRLENKFFPFDNLLLNRSRAYYDIQYRQVDLWKSGLILKRIK